MLLMEVIQDMTGIRGIDGPPAVEINSIEYDSRKVGPGSLFCAIRGLQIR